MSRYLYGDWMTDCRLLETDFIHIGTARKVLTGWSDSKTRRVERYLNRIARLSRTHEWAMLVEERWPTLFIAGLRLEERLAVNILRLAALGVHAESGGAEKDLYQSECERLEKILVLERVAPDLEKAKKYRKHQSKNAKAPRGRLSHDARTLGDLIATLARNHPEEMPRNIWPHLQSSISDWAGSCEEKKRGKQKIYKYEYREKYKTISEKQFGVRLRQARKNLINTV